MIFKTTFDHGVITYSFLNKGDCVMNILQNWVLYMLNSSLQRCCHGLKYCSAILNFFLLLFLNYWAKSRNSKNYFNPKLLSYLSSLAYLPFLYIVKQQNIILYINAFSYMFFENVLNHPFSLTTCKSLLSKHCLY